MRTLVFGGRDYQNQKRLMQVLDSVHHDSPVTVLVEGGEPRGADRMARTWAQMHGIAVETHKADWSRYGTAAGMIRNAEMASSAIDRAVEFPTGGPGSRNMAAQLAVLWGAGSERLLIVL